MQTREVIDEGPQHIDFESYAAHFALTPKTQAIVARRIQEDVEGNAARQREIEAKKDVDEWEP